jgi:sulfatase maturation enzyme AslB (radical SAM superfamily)
MTIRALHIELSSHCNAYCLGCSRTSEMALAADNPLQPSHISEDVLDNIINSTSFKDIEFVYFCGVLGDPLSHPAIVSNLKNLFKKNNKLRVQIHTNGSLGSKMTWEDLASLSVEYSLKITFSVDGLEDTNHLYRQGVSFERVLENAKTYIENGGHAIWKFIEFSVNAHQIEQARGLSKRMGFYEFQVRQPYDDERVPGKLKLEDVKNQKVSARPFESFSTEALAKQLVENIKKVKPISCQAEERKEIYIDSYAQVWPCCWLGNLGLSRLSIAEREHFHRTTLANYEVGFNSLLKYSLDEILDHQWFNKDLKESWSNTPLDAENPCSPTCLKYCGKA